MNLRYVNALIKEIWYEGDARDIMNMTFETEIGNIRWQFGMKGEIDQWVVSMMMRKLFNVVDEDDMKWFPIRLALDDKLYVVGVGNIVKDIIIPCNPGRKSFMKRAYTKERFKRKYQRIMAKNK